MILFERGIKQMPLKVVVGGAIGLVLGLMLANLLISAFFTGLSIGKKVTVQGSLSGTVIQWSSASRKD